jgi:hypothetical protein
MDETKHAWDEVGDGFTKLGRMISERYKLQEGQEAKPSGGSENSAVSDAVRRATEELDRAFTSLGDTLRDDDAQAQMRETGKKLTDALRVTFNEVADEVRRAIGSRGSGGSDEPPGATPSAGSRDPA